MEKFEASLIDVLRGVVTDCLETETEIIIEALRETVPSLDADIKKMGLDSFEATVYYAIWQVAEEKCAELARRVQKSGRRF